MKRGVVAHLQHHFGAVRLENFFILRDSWSSQGHSRNQHSFEHLDSQSRSKQPLTGWLSPLLILQPIRWEHGTWLRWPTNHKWAEWRWTNVIFDNSRNLPFRFFFLYTSWRRKGIPADKLSQRTQADKSSRKRHDTVNRPTQTQTTASITEQLINHQKKRFLFPLKTPSLRSMLSREHRRICVCEEVSVMDATCICSHTRWSCTMFVRPFMDSFCGGY